MTGRLGWSGWLGLLVGWVVLVGGRADAAPFEPGQIFIAYNSNNIGVFADTISTTGNLIGTINLSPSTFATNPLNLAGGGVALDESGNLYVTVQKLKLGDTDSNQSNQGIIKINPAGNVALSIEATIDFRGIAVRGGVIYVASESGVRRFNATTGDAISPILASGTRFRDVTLDPQGNLYALRSDGVTKWSAGSISGSGTPLFSIPTEDPRAIVTDEDGNLYITFATTKVVRKYSPTGSLLATYSSPSGTGTLIGLDYDPGTQRLFASHTGTGIGQILWIDRNASSGSPMTAFGPTNLSGVRWLALYPTPEPSVALLVLAGGAALWWRHRQGGRESVHRKRE
jgi:hypothetical protein